MSLIILCGYGPVGRTCLQKLEMETDNIVVIDKNPEKLRDLSHTYVVGDATREEVLRRAGIEKAGALIAAAGSDITNAFITLTAKSINPEIRVYTTAERLESVDKLYKAGADYVVPESSIGARELVNGALQYTENRGRIYLGNGMEVHAMESMRSGSIREISGMSGAITLALRREKNIFYPGNGRYEKGDVLYVLGNSRQIGIVRKILENR